MPKILVRAPNWLGDALMSMPFLKRLGEANPDAEIDVLCRASLKELYAGAPGAARVIPFEGPRPALNAVRRGEYGQAYVLPPSLSSAFHLFFCAIPRRVGYAGDFRRWLLTEPLELDERYHYVRRYLGLIGEEGRDVSPADFYFPKPVDGAQKAEAVLASRKIPWKAPFLALAPGSQARARRWPAERFADLLNSLPESEWPTVFLLGAPQDTSVAMEVAEHSKRPLINLCGKTDLIALGDILRNCGGLVTNESGMMHVAWAVGTPAVVLAGPSEPRVTSPFGAKVKIIQHREVPCVPCIKNECFRRGRGYKECMKSIEIGEVLAALRSLAK